MMVPVSAASNGTPKSISIATDPASKPPSPPGKADNVAAMVANTTVTKAVRKLTEIHSDFKTVQSVPLSNKNIVRFNRLAITNRFGEYNCSGETDLITFLACCNRFIFESQEGNSLFLLATIQS